MYLACIFYISNQLLTAYIYFTLKLNFNDGWMYSLHGFLKNPFLFLKVFVSTMFHLNKHGIICITNILCISILSCGHIIFSKGKPTTNCCLEYKREFWVKLGMYLSCRNLLIMTQIILKQHNIWYLYLYMNWCIYIIVGIKFKKCGYENEIQWWNC